MSGNIQGGSSHLSEAQKQQAIIATLTAEIDRLRALVEAKDKALDLCGDDCPCGGRYSIKLHEDYCEHALARAEVDRLEAAILSAD